MNKVIPVVTTSLMKFVQLKIFDILGLEIATLVNEETPTGTYEIEFNAESLSNRRASLSSVLYFYILQTGDLIQSGKMIYLK